METKPVIMAPIRLPCLVGGECNFQTVQLEYEQAKAQQDGHMQYAHGAVEEYTPVGPALVRQLRQQLKSLDETVKAIEANDSRELATKTVRVIRASPASTAASGLGKTRQKRKSAPSPTTAVYRRS